MCRALVDSILNKQDRKDYYQFIYTESERLTRLINNIPQLSKLSHHQQILIMNIDAPENVQVLVDQDTFSQVVINITDNAVKFFDSDTINEEQDNKIFELFYRGGNELTRTSERTGIGLALVNELVHPQQGGINVKRKSPGLAMILPFTARG